MAKHLNSFLSITLPLLAPLSFCHTYPTREQHNTTFSALAVEQLSTAGGKSHSSGDCCPYKFPFSHLS